MTDPVAEAVARLQTKTAQFHEGVGMTVLTWEQVLALRTVLSALERRTKALEEAAAMLSSVAGDLEDGYDLKDLRGKYLMAVVNARDDAREALAALSGE